jgi:hypothetical protein
MEFPLLFRAIEKFADRLANQPSQGEAMLVGHLLEALKLFDGQGYRRSRSLHVSSICISLQHLACVCMPRPIYVDIRERDIGSYVAEAQKAVADKVKFPPGYYATWNGRFEYMQRTTARMKIVVPMRPAIVRPPLRHASELRSRLCSARSGSRTESGSSAGARRSPTVGARFRVG